MNLVSKLFDRANNATEPNSVLSDSETIERIISRAESASLLTDRRDALRALKALSHSYRHEVGRKAVHVLLARLQTDRSDAESTNYALDCLCTLVAGSADQDDDDDQLGQEMADAVVSNAANIDLCLSLLEEFDFRVRWPAIRLVSALCASRSQLVQEAVLKNPMALGKVVDLLSDSRDVVRNDGLLLLGHLVNGNVNVQKIVVFENAFERFFEIIHDEGLSDGSIVVEDCLLLIWNLLRNNQSNQNFFREGSFIQQLPAFFQPLTESAHNDEQWSAQKTENVLKMLQVVRALVSPDGASNSVTAAQNVLLQCGVLAQLCDILMAAGIPAPVLSETINTVAEVIRANSTNQAFFAGVQAPSTPPRPAVVVLLLSMINERQPFPLRASIAYCFRSFLAKNNIGRAQVIATLLPSDASDVNTVSAGQLLCTGLFSQDPLGAWFSAVSLMHTILDDDGSSKNSPDRVEALVTGPTENTRQQLLRVQLATSPGQEPTSLLQHCCQVYAALPVHSSTVQTRVGLLMLMSVWLTHCEAAVQQFVAFPRSCTHLIGIVRSEESLDDAEQVVQGLSAFLLGLCVVFNSDQSKHYDRSSLLEIIRDRIGVDTFCSRLNLVSKNDLFVKAAKRAQMTAAEPTDLLFEHEFTRFFKRLEPEVAKHVQVSVTDDGATELSLSAQALVDQYKSLIREQDKTISDLRAELSTALSRCSEVEQLCSQQALTIDELRNQNAVLKATSSQMPLHPSSELEVSEPTTRENPSESERKEPADDAEQQQFDSVVHSKQLEEIEQLKAANESQTKQLDHLNKEKTELAEELSTVRQEQDDLLVLLADLDSKLKTYRRRLRLLNEPVSDDDDDNGDDDNEGQQKERDPQRPSGQVEVNVEADENVEVDEVADDSIVDDSVVGNSADVEVTTRAPVLDGVSGD